MNERNAQNQNNDFSNIARMKRFIRANKKNFIGLGICLFIVFIFFAVIIISSLIDSDDYLNYENYEKIEIGMTYEEVVELLDNHIGRSMYPSGRGGGIYAWSNDSGSRKIVIAFDQKGLVVNIKQFGLD